MKTDIDVTSVGHASPGTAKPVVKPASRLGVAWLGAAWLGAALLLAALAAAPGARAADATAGAEPAVSAQQAAETTAAANAARVDRTPFDHLTTGFELIGKHRDLPCESCHVNAIFKGTPHDCASCHGVGTQVRATAKPVTHILTTNRCDGCHTPVAFDPAVNFDHAEVRGTCSSCHFNGGPAQGQPPGHIATNLECDACHSTIGWSGALGASLPANHIPVNQQCGVCHTDPTNWAIAAMNHVGITGNCAQCHYTGNTFLGSPMAPPGNHVPFGSAACESCHLASSTNTGGFAFTNASTTAPAGMVHTAVGSARCDACHASGMTWAGSPATVTFPATHVAIAGADCKTCHAGTSTFKFTNASGTAPPAMVHSAVSSLACSSCHEKGMTDIGTPATIVRPATKASGATHIQVGECSTCHFSTSTFKGATDLPTNHMPLLAPSTVNCQDCHSNPNDYSVYAMGATGHADVTTACSTCHASGKSFQNMAPPVLKQPPTNHVPFGTAECTACHSASNFTTFQMTNTSAAAPAAMVHAAVPGTACNTCHAAGLTWVGAPATLTSSNTGTASPHVPLPTGVACESCHVAANTLPGGFSITNASGTAPPAMVHSVVGSIACDQCHGSGKVFAGAPATVTISNRGTAHVPIPAGTACTTCHSATNFTSFSFTNASTTAAPGMVHTAVAATACSTCHEKGLTWLGTPATVLRPVLKASGAPHVQTGECSTCHLNTTSFKGASDVPAGHIPLLAPSTVNCVDCHASAPTDYSVYTMGATGHADVAATCSTCHSTGKSFTNMAPPTLKLPPANHVPFGSAECTTCHSASNFTTFQMANASGTAPPAMVHAAVPGVACATCHASGQNWVGTPATKAPPSNHVPFGTAACESCHLASSTATGGFAFTNASGTAPPAMVHSAVGSIACDQCHAANLTFVGTPATKVVPGNHVPFPAGTACTTCHSASNFTTFVMTNASTTAAPGMVHTAVTSIVCSTCHEAGKTWAGTPATVTRPALKANGTAHVTGGECSTCHFNTTSFKGASDLPANHLPLPAADNNNCALCHTNPATYSTATMNHVNITSNCAQCHASGLSFANMAPPTLVQPPTNHVPFGTAACEGCHLASSTATGGFKFTSQSTTTPAGMVHSVVSSQACASCHALANTWLGSPMPPPANHVPFGTAACESCHLASSVATGGWKFTNASGTAPPSMVHSAVSSAACETCHGPSLTWAGTPATVTTTNRTLTHIPYPAGTACKGCHSATNFTTFSFTNASTTAPAGMVHTLVTSIACSTCHEKGKTWLGSPATVVRPALKANGQAHVTGGECSTCHFNTTSFKGATDLPSNHIPLPAADNNNCALCHTNTNDYSVYTMNHVNITSNCIQCHGYGLSFANMAPPTLKAPPSGATGHIPSNKPNGTTDIACENCHSKTVFTTFAGTIMRHSYVKSMTCMSCHELGMTWKTNTGVRLWVRDSANHHKGQDCGGSGCHSTKDKFAPRRAVSLNPAQKAVSLAAGNGGTGGAATSLGGGAAVNHVRLAGSDCSSCHSAASGLGKPVGHMATSSACGSCHGTGAWSPVLRIDHTQVLGACATCHDGRTATGKATSHIASGTACETCHTTVAWAPARFDHGAVAAHTCTTCHDSVHASGKPTNHVPTSAQCDSCHGTLAWKPAKLDHTTLTAACATCHNNSIALGVPVGHLGTQRDCATCHSYPDWTALHFVHASASYPGTHRAALACAACHTTNTDQVAWASPADAGTCGGCHAKDFKPALHPKTKTGVNYTANELHDCTGACHVYTDATLATVSKPQPGPYHRVSDAAFKH